MPVRVWFALATVSASIFWAAQNFSATIRIGRDSHAASLAPAVEQLSCPSGALRFRHAEEQIATLEAKLARTKAQLRSAKTLLWIARQEMMEPLVLGKELD